MKIKYFVTTILLFIFLNINHGYSAENNYRQSFSQNAINIKAGYALIIKKSDNDWVIAKLDFLGTLTEGPIVKGAYGALAFNDFIVVPLISGQVEVYNLELTNKWSFSVPNERIIAAWSRIEDNGQLALLSLDAKTQNKFLNIYEIDPDKKYANELHSRELDASGILSLSYFGGSLWLITPESADLIYKIK